MTEIFYYQRLIFEFCEEAHRTTLQPSNIKPPKITISTTPTMTKNDGSALPPHSNLQRSFHHKSTPTRLPSMIRRFLPCLALRMRPAARLFPTGQFPPERLINEPLLASDVLAPPKLQAPPHSSHRSISIVLSRGEEEKVSIMFIPLRISSETHLVFYYFPAAAVTSADLVSWGCRGLSISRPNRNRRYRATTKARR